MTASAERPEPASTRQRGRDHLNTEMRRGCFKSRGQPFLLPKDRPSLVAARHDMMPASHSLDAQRPCHVLLRQSATLIVKFKDVTLGLTGFGIRVVVILNLSSWSYCGHTSLPTRQM